MALLFQRKAPDLRAGATAKLVAHARTVIGADDDTAVSVSQHDCGDPACRSATIVLVMRAKQPTEAVKIDKPLEQVTQADVSDALAPLTARAGASHPVSRASSDQAPRSGKE
jgi:hypothetical protein